MGDLDKLCNYFSVIKDPRKDKGKRHKLQDIIVISVCAVICGADNFKNMELFGKAKKDWFNTFLELKHGVPSEDTFGRIFAAIDPDEFKNCFIEWVKSISNLIKGEIIAIDGKTVCNSHDKTNNKNPIHVVSAWANSAKLVLGQEKVDEKSNEITAIPKLLELLKLEGCTITIDAMGCQKSIAEKIRDENANYVLALKKNHKDFYDDVECFFEMEGKNNFRDISYSYHETVTKDHGRIEKRRYWITSDIGWLSNKEEWKDLECIGMVESERIIGEKKTVEKRYYISSLEENAEKFGDAVREHWGIENSLHWVLDVAFDEDNSRARIQNSAENLTILRKLALNALKKEDTINAGIKSKRLKAGWDTDYLLKVLAVL